MKAKVNGPEWFLKYQQHLTEELAECGTNSEISESNESIEPDLPDPVQEVKYRFHPYENLPSTKCYVYVITDGTFLKIGMANDVQKRLAQLQTGNPMALHLVRCYEFSNRADASKYERKLHLKYNNYRKNGEWFFIPYGTIVGFGDPDDIVPGYKRYCSDIPFRERKAKKKKRNQQNHLRRTNYE